MKDKFTLILVIGLLIMGGILTFIKSQHSYSNDLNTIKYHFFYHPDCKHCKSQKRFNKKVIKTFPTLQIITHNISQPKEASLLLDFANKYEIPHSKLGVPATFINSFYLIGYGDDETSDKKIITAIEAALKGEKYQSRELIPQEAQSITLPILGTIKLKNYSLPTLAIILGIIDGFNPCAMWVLAYLISLIANINEKKKIWFLIGSFIVASGVLYFLFMAAWLNVFLFIGYLSWLTLLIGLFALGTGILSLRDYIINKGQIACKVGNIESRQKTMSRVKSIVFAPLYLYSIFGIIILAYVVNSIEFLCSSAIPAIFTHVLAINDLSTWQHYGYILLYIFFFMLDDLIIFGLAAFALNSSFGTRYANYCKVIGALIMIYLGLILSFRDLYL